MRENFFNYICLIKFFACNPNAKMLSSTGYEKLEQLEVINNKVLFF